MLRRFITQVGKLYWWHHCFSISHHWFNNKAIFVAQFPWKKCLLAGNKSFGTRFRVLLNVCWQIQTNSDWRNTEGGSVDRGKQHWCGYIWMWWRCATRCAKCYRNRKKNNILYLKNGLSQFMSFLSWRKHICAAKTQKGISPKLSQFSFSPLCLYVTALHDATVTL